MIRAFIARVKAGKINQQFPVTGTLRRERFQSLENMAENTHGH
jgi:hypothetical protein